MENGFNDDMWQPFESWVATTHPTDFLKMFGGAEFASEAEGLRTWRHHVAEYVDDLQG